MNMTDTKKRNAEQIWLAYFNKVLFEKGHITEKMRNRMTMKIDTRNKPAK